MPNNGRPLGLPRSIRGQLTVLFLALAIPLLFLQTWWSYHDYRSAQEEAWSDALAFADAVDLAIGQFLEQSGELVRASAAQSGRLWLTQGGCEDELQMLSELLPYDNVLLIRADGAIVCSAATVPPGASAAIWPWYGQFRTSQRFTIGEPVEADFTGSWILPMIEPIQDADGVLLGGLIATVPLSELSRILANIRPSGQQLTSVASADSMIVARSSDAEEYVGTRVPPPTGTDRLIAPGRWVAEGADLTGVQRTWGQVETASGWIVYVGVPNEAVLGPALREALSHVGGTLLVVLLGVLLAGLSYTRIAGALRELAQRTRATRSGELVPLPADTPKEISEVVDQFNETLQGRARAEMAEREARERFQSIFDNAAFGIYVSTPDGRFLQVNPALVQMLGYSSEEALIDAGPAALYAHPEQREEHVSQALQRGYVRPDAIEFEWLRADGTPIIVRLTGKLLRDREDRPVFEMIVQDVTDEKRTEDQLRQTQKMEAIGQLAGGVAHDFNNLLTVIGGNVELLEDELEAAHPIRDDLDQIAKATKRAGALTRRLLAFSRPSRRGQQTVDLDEVVRELAKMLVPLIGETVVLDCETEPGMHFVTIDPGELEQLLVNLVLNARDAIHHDGRIRLQTVRDMREMGGQRQPVVGMRVVDDGIGMDDDTRHRIFEPFFTTKPMGEGTGLGLSTAYGIVKRAGGEISVESEPGRGTEVTVWFPAASPREVVRRPTPDVDDVTGTESVLVVEDDELVRRFVGRTLEDAGFGVYLAASGDEALAFLGEGTHPIDLVLTDIIMPGLTGPELAERLRTESPHTPVLFMSGYVENPGLARSLGDRPDALLRKPFSPAELKTRVRQTLDRASRAPAPS